MDWDDLRFFLAVAEQGSLSAAAVQLKVSPSTVARRIESFEKSTQAKLFTAHRDGYDLTETGRAILPAAQRAAGEIARFQKAMQATDPQRSIRIEAPELLGHALLPVIGKVMAEFPDLRIEMRGSVRPVRLAAQEADIVLRLVRPEQGDYKMRKLGRLGFRLYGAPTLPQPASNDDLRGMPLIGWPSELDYLLMSRWLSDLYPTARPRLQLSSLGAQLRAAIDGLGWAVLPDFAAKPAGLVQANADLPAFHADLWLLTRPQLEGPAATRLCQGLSDAIAGL